MTGVVFLPTSFPTTIIRVFLVYLISIVCVTDMIRTKTAQSVSVHTGSYHVTDGRMDMQVVDEATRA